MKIGVVGLGKLGLPVAVAIDSKGHEVHGYDISSSPSEYLRNRRIPFVEKGLQPLLDSHSVVVHESLDEVIAASDIVFLPVQTPHGPEFEGSTRIPDERADFDYSWLLSAITNVTESADRLEKDIDLVVISTCLPGTYREHIEPIVSASAHVDYFYNPFFIAMGTVLDDFLNPEFVLLGADSDADPVIDFYETIHDRPVLATDITTAEGIKVSYNTFITMKTVLANVWGELSEKIGMNFDDIYRAWSISSERLISPKYLKAGMGDGGGCHPRDNIALSWLAKKTDLSHNIFEDLMAAREDHAEWLADLTVDTAFRVGLQISILGRAFKPETNIETGSPSVLVANIVRELLEKYDSDTPVRHVEDVAEGDLVPAVYLIGTQHERYENYVFPVGSVVIDPFRYLPEQDGVRYIHIGDGK